MSYRYSTAEVWLTDLGEHHPATHDLCPHHADSLTVPNGWTLVDTRQPMEAPREPSAAEIVERATRLRSGVTAMLEAASAPEEPERPPSRYTSLLETLPTYAPEGETADDGPAVDEPTRADAEREGRASAVRVVAGLTRELAPVIREMAADLAGPVVGTIEIDLDDQPESAAETPEKVETPGVRDQIDQVDESAESGPVQGAMVFQLPLRHDDSTVE